MGTGSAGIDVEARVLWAMGGGRDRGHAGRAGVDVSALEEVELRAWEDVARAARELGLPGGEVVRTGAGGALFSPGVDDLAVNRAFGMVADRVPLAELASALVEAFRARAVPRFSFQPVPGEDGAATGDILAAVGFRPGPRWVRLHRPAGGVPWVLSDLDVVPADGMGRLFGEVYRAALDLPTFTVSWLAALVERPGWRCFVALDGVRPVAAGAVHVQGPRAWLGLTATLPDHRRRGAHLAVLAEMALQASRLGCRDLVLEAVEERPGRPSPAHRNARRLGFRAAYHRESWIYDRAS